MTRDILLQPNGAPDGRVDSLQTLHNLNEDELSGFEENWKSNADTVLPGWTNGFNLIENAGFNNGGWDDFANISSWGSWPFPALENFGNAARAESSDESRRHSRGENRKVVPVE